MDIIKHLSELDRDLEGGGDINNIRERIDVLLDQKISLFFKADPSVIVDLLQKIIANLRDRKIGGVKNQSFEEAAFFRDLENKTERTLFYLKSTTMGNNQTGKSSGLTIIGAEEFTSLWKEFIKTKICSNNEWIDWYNSEAKKWTEKTIGRPVSEEENSPFGDFFTERKALRYRKEDGLFDLAFAAEESFHGIESLHSEKKDRKNPFEGSFYPTEYSILVEHENDIYRCTEEMAKLAYSLVPLKVLITYNDNVDGEDYSYIPGIVVQNFERIIKQANSNYQENNSTKYLLVIGQLKDGEVGWKGWVFDIHGESKSLN